MKSYSIISPMNNPLSIVDYNEIANVINKNFPGSLREKVDLRKTIIASYTINGREIMITYRQNSSKLSIPNDKIKELFESKTKLRLENIK